MDFVFIHGAPGTGKSSLAWALSRKWNRPCFEFGWIPEFRTKAHSTLTYAEEEAFAFENLRLVVRNYQKHGFDRVILTDIRDHLLQELPRWFAPHEYALFTLWVEDEAQLKERVLDEKRSSAYRDWAASVELNRTIQTRPLCRAKCASIARGGQRMSLCFESRKS